MAAAERRRAENALLGLRVVQAAVGSCFDKRNQRAVEKLHAELKKLL